MFAGSLITFTQTEVEGKIILKNHHQSKYFQFFNQRLMRRNSAESERVLPSFTLEENVNEKENQSLSSPSRHWMAPLQIKLLRISSLFFFCPSTGHFCRWAWQLQSQIDSPSFFLDGCVCFIIQWFFLWIFFVALLCFVCVGACVSYRLEDGNRQRGSPVVMCGPTFIAMRCRSRVRAPDNSRPAL